MSLVQFSVPACCNQAMNGGLFHQVQFQQLLLKHGNPGTPQDQSCVRLSLNWVPSLMSRSCCSNPKCCNPTRPSLALHASSSVTGGQYSSGSGELLDARKERKRTRTRKIAGVDQNELLDPQLLADTDSCFCEFKGVQIHHKVYDPGSTVGGDSSQSQGQAFSEQSQKLGLPVILLHGFGASVFSWSRVMQPLAEAIRSKALAFDRPAFGLTSRVSFLGESPPARNDTKPLNPYSMAFSVLATLYFIDFLAAEKAILVGHSAGSLVAVNTYFDAPERVAALILVAPAIFAPRATNNPVGVGTSERNNKNEGEDSASSDVRKPFVKTFEILSRFIQYISDAIMRMVKGMTDMLSSLYKKMLSAILQSALAVMLVRMLIDKFGIPAVKNAWYDSKRVGEHILLGYTKPLRAKGWDRALVEFTAAMLLHNESETKPPLAKRLHEISCPVLIVTGDTDRIVPAWNAMRLAKAIPGSTLEVIKNCGHLPHEEKVEEFVSVVKKFLHKSFGGSEHSFQAVTC